MILLTILMLAVMEVSLSFDNAVVNASVLRRMSTRWQGIFLTWGILVAVFGMRLILPVVIAAVASGSGLIEVASMAWGRPDEYASRLLASHSVIASFGGMFLLMVFLHFVCDEAKETHWIAPVEKGLSTLGRMEAVQVGIALLTLLCIQAVVPGGERLVVVLAGIAGLACYTLVNGLSGLFGDAEGAAGKSGLAAFVYLEILDASFSLDGVIGAFAMSSDVIVIMTGLGIGAACIRSLTVHLVRKGTLEEFVFLEHGAHWGIGALAAIMLATTTIHISEIVTGLAGVSFIGLSLLSSIQHKRRLGHA